MVVFLFFRPRRNRWFFPKEENLDGRSWYEERAINAGYLSGDMLVEHRCRYNWGLEGETYCHICAKWVRDSDSEKCTAVNVKKHYPSVTLGGKRSLKERSTFGR